MVLLRCGNRRHGVRDLADQARKVLLFGAKLGAHFRKFIEDALALFRQRNRRSMFSSAMAFALWRKHAAVRKPHSGFFKSQP